MMKTRGIIVYFILLIVFVGQSAYAQDIDPKEKANERRESLTPMLDLSVKQGKEVYNAIIRFWDRTFEIRKSNNSQKEKEQRRKEIADKYEEELKDILTTEQYKKLLEVREALAKKNKKD